MYIKFMISIVVFRGIFDIVFSLLLKAKPQLFASIYRITGEWKFRKIYEFIAFIILLIPWAMISIHFDLSYIINGIVGGFIMTVCNIAFREPKKLGN